MDKELELMIKLTNRAELLGFEINDKLYLDGNKDTYYGKIFRFFSMDNVNDFLDDSKKDKYEDIFVEAFESIEKGSISGKVINEKIIWEKRNER